MTQTLSLPPVDPPRGTLAILDADSAAGRDRRDALVCRGENLLDEDVLGKAGAIVGEVRRSGDTALLDAVRRYDSVDVTTAADLRLDPKVDEDELPDGLAAALERAIGAVEDYHRRQVHEGFTTTRGGILLEERRRPLKRVGLYVPGGLAAYPSTVLMTVIPARLAGVDEIAVATPPATWHTSPALRYALSRLKVEEVWGMGGAHAVAALAYGTESVARVDKIAGPGNAWVTAAKHLVQTDVAIDAIAGPSEVVVVASDGADAAVVAADLLAQAEHDPLATAILVTDRRDLAEEVAAEIERQLPDFATAEVARASIAEQGAAFVVAAIGDAVELVNALAPEHLQLVGNAAEALVEEMDAAGAIFVGASTPEVFGDYVAGPSHVLPTAGTARFASALGVEDFVRRSHVVRFDRDAAASWAETAAAIADVEGLPAHAAAARRRA